MIPQSTPEVQAIRDAAAQLLALPGREAEAPMVARGLTLALAGAVGSDPDGTIRVHSATGEGRYVVQGTSCQCLFNRRAPGGRCKHWYAVEILRRAQGPREALPVGDALTGRLYTLGYAGWQLADLFEAVRRRNAVLADIRFSPASRHPQWSRKQLRALLGDRYRHVQELGNVNYKTGGEIVLADYEEGRAIIARLLAQGRNLTFPMCRWDEISC